MGIHVNIPKNQVVEGGGFEPPKLARQIYSLIPLATREPLRTQAGILLTHSTIVKQFLVIFHKLSHAEGKMELAIGVEPTTC
jgi:hypothetical protein